MMQIYYMRVSWISGIAFFLAFLLTFWPSRSRMTVGAALWMVGILSITGMSAYNMFQGGSISYAFSPSGNFPLFGWLIPLVSLLLAITESILLFPWISQELAIRLGRVLFLVIVPAFVLLTSLPYIHQGGFWQFPLGISWLGYPLLWFRIREKQDDRSKRS
jgi:hypothetical protein